jgi:hypothetical protein
MHSTVKRLAVLGALSMMLGIAAPVASAGAASTSVASARVAGLPFPAAGFPGFAGGGLPFGGAGLSGQAVWGSVVGPVIITTAPSSFINTNNQVSAGGNVSGGQVVLP